MTESSLYIRSSTYGGMYAMLIVNRLQMIYFMLIFPKHLIHGYMLWGIVAVGLLSQLNLRFIASWFGSKTAARGFEGFAVALGEGRIRWLAALALVPLFVKTAVTVFGYSEIVHHYIFAAMDVNWPALFIMLTAVYVASHGMEKTIRFSVIAFLASAWLLVIYIPFFMPSTADYRDLFPLLPDDWSDWSWKALLMVWASLSGPEYIVFLSPWLNPGKKAFTYLSAANALSVVEYLVLFISTVLFYGPDYLHDADYPVLNMIRYLQTPVFERLEIAVIALHMFHVVFVLAILLLFMHGAVRVATGKHRKPGTSRGFLVTGATAAAAILMLLEWSWKREAGQLLWPWLQVGMAAATYAVVPLLLAAFMKRKGSV